MSSKMVLKGNSAGWSPFVKIYDPLKAGSIDGTDLIPHDNAVVRAMSAKYTPPNESKVTSDPSHTLFVGRLNLRTSERQLTEEFSTYGSIKSCRLVQDIVTGMSRGYGFVEFKREADAQKAWKNAHGSIFHDRQILVEWEFSRTMPGWIPRRLGGGLGGRKESGQLRFGGRDRPFKRPFILPPEQEDPVMISESACSSQLSDTSTKAKEGFDVIGGKAYETSSRLSKNELDSKESISKNRFDEGRRKYNRYPEERYSDQLYHEGDRAKYWKDTEDKCSGQGSYDQHRKKYRREYADSSHYEEDRRNSRRNMEEKGGGYENDNQHRTKYRRDNEDNYADSCYYEEGRKNSRRYVEQKSTGCEEDDQHIKKYRRDYDDKHPDSSYHEKGRKNSKRYLEDKSAGYEKDDQHRKKYRRDYDDKHPDSSYYEEGRKNSKKYLEDKSTGYEEDKRKHKKYSEDEYYNESDKKKSSRYLEDSHSSSHFDREVNQDKYKRVEKDSFTLPSFDSRQSESEICKGGDEYLNRLQSYETTYKENSKRSSSSDSTSSQASTSKRKHKKTKRRKKRHQSVSSERDPFSKPETTKMHKKKRKKEKKKRKHSNDEEMN